MVNFGPKKVVVLAGYRTVKQALVNQAKEFGNREVTPIFYDFNKEHGKLMFFIKSIAPFSITVKTCDYFVFRYFVCEWRIVE